MGFTEPRKRSKLIFVFAFVAGLVVAFNTLKFYVMERESISCGW